MTDIQAGIVAGETIHWTMRVKMPGYGFPLTGAADLHFRSAPDNVVVALEFSTANKSIRFGDYNSNTNEVVWYLRANAAQTANLTGTSYVGDILYRDGGNADYFGRVALTVIPRVTRTPLAAISFDDDPAWPTPVDIAGADESTILSLTERGPPGPIPGHRWTGTSIAFQNPNGDFGDAIDLRGEQGLPGALSPDGLAAAQSAIDAATSAGLHRAAAETAAGAAAIAAVTATRGVAFDDVASARAALIPASVERVGVYVGSRWIDAVRVNSAEDVGFTDAAGGYWAWRPDFVTTDLAESGDLAAAAAFAAGAPMRLGDESVNLVLTLDPADGRANHSLIRAATKWRATCLVGSGGRLNLHIATPGVYPWTVWDIDGDGRPALDWNGGAASAWSLSAPSGLGAKIDIIGATLGARGASHHPIYRTSSQYPVTFTLATALPDHVKVGSALLVQDLVGNNDAGALSGAYICEWIAADRLSWRGTTTSGSTADLVAPTTITNGGTWNGIASSTLIAPPVTLLWDTDFSIGAAIAVAAIANGANGPSGATTLNMTAPGHGMAAGALIVTTGVNAGVDGRRMRVYACPSADTLVVTTLNGDAIDATGLALTAGGTVAAWTETLTGSAQEGLINSDSGSIIIDGVGLSYAGWLRNATGIYMDQDAIYCGAAMAGVNVLNGAVIAGAGDKCVRLYAARSAYISYSGVGGGGCQSALYAQACGAQVIRSHVGQSTRESVIATVSGAIILNAAVITGSGTTLISAQDTTTASVYPSRLAGALRAVYPVSGGSVRLSSTTEIDSVSTAIDAYGFPTVVSGLPAFGARVTTQSTLTQDGVGGASSNKGNSRWIVSPTGNQSPPALLNTLSVKATGVLAMTTGASMTGVLAMGGGAGFKDAALSGVTVFAAGASVTADKGTVTADAGGAATLNKMAGTITTAALTTAAGASATITVTNSLVTAASLITLTRQAGTSTAGYPDIEVASVAAGAFTVKINNRHASAALNGSVRFSFEVK